jgi:2,4-dienoyl-CoA reductase (NADPH2)
MGRALLADPELPNKAFAGNFDEIVPCIACNYGCHGNLSSGKPITCLVNPALGKEREMTITLAKKPKKVLVAGGGPGGLEAALVSALRGHQVTLFEKSNKLGGQLNIASVAPLKQELSLIIKYLSIQIEKAGIKVELSREVTPNLVQKLNPDIVIVATGATPLIPNIPGVKNEKVITAYDVLAGKVVVGNNVIIIGGGMVGCEVADFVADNRDNPIINRTVVTIVEMLEDIALDMAPASRLLLMPRLREKGVEVITYAKVKEILDDGVVYVKNGQERSIRGMDNIVLALGTKSVDEISNKIRDIVSEVYVVGDAKEPRKALEAIAEGAEIARKI